MAGSLALHDKPCHHPVAELAADSVPVSALCVFDHWMQACAAPLRRMLS